MKTITPLDLRRSLGRILDEASAGQRFLIIRDHHPLAVLVSMDDAARLDGSDDERRKRLRAAGAALEEYRRRIGRDGISSVEWIRRDRDAEVHGHWGELEDGDQ